MLYIIIFDTHLLMFVFISKIFLKNFNIIKKYSTNHYPILFICSLGPQWLYLGATQEFFLAGTGCQVWASRRDGRRQQELEVQ